MYPYIKIDRDRLSLIGPFTINDKLITDIHTNINISDAFLEKSYMFTLHDHSSCTMTFNCEFLHQIIKDAYRRTIEDETQNRDIRNLCEAMQHIIENTPSQTAIDIVIERIYQQCDNLRRGTYSLSYYATILGDQERPRLRNIYGFVDNAVEALSFGVHDFGIDYNELSERWRNIEARISNASIDLSALREVAVYGSTATTSETTDIIHRYNYVPEYKKHYLPGENNSSLLLGAEIEVDGGGESEEHASQVLKIMNGDDQEENIYCMHDGSLARGFEFATQPGTLGWHKTLPYKKMFKYLTDNGYRAHDTNTCGLHIHINRSYFPDETCICKLVYIVEKFRKELEILGRRGAGRYSVFCGYNGKKAKDTFEDYKNNATKYSAVNLQHADTIELRFFKGTLKYSTFMNTLDFVADLALFVKDHTEEEIENTTWEDLYSTFTDDLKAYYDDRVEKADTKQNNKQQSDASADASANTSTDTSVSFIPCNNPDPLDDIWNIYYAHMYYRPTENINQSQVLAYEPIIRDDVISYEEFERTIDAFNSAVNPSLLEFFADQHTSVDYDNLPINKKIKQLKKMLKHERNYIARKKLEQEIQKLKRERRTNGRNN